MSVVLCYLQNGKAYQQFVGFVHISSLHAASLVEYIRNTMSACHLSFDKINVSSSATMHGANVMSGACSGVQAKIKKKLLLVLIYTHIVVLIA